MAVGDKAVNEWKQIDANSWQRTRKGCIQEVERDEDGLWVEEDVGGYGGYRARIFVPDSVLRMLGYTLRAHEETGGGEEKG
jgi:hypothetical protein